MQSPQSTAKTVHLPDLHGAARLLVDATSGIVGIVEAMHHTIASRAHPIGAAPPGRTTGITGLVYRTIHAATHLTGQGMDAAGKTLAASPAQDVAPAAPGPKRQAVIAALNGVFGDHLAATGNKLAIPMRLRQGHLALNLTADSLRAEIPNAKPRLIILVHGLCLNHLSWRRENHDHGASLAADLNATSLYLHYNTGRHVSENGADFARLLNALTANWPVPVEELTLIGHSMGGLVARSACLHGGGFLSHLKHLVFLGTPHHGAALERGGLMLDQLLGASPYVAPFARLGKARSAGITDLRFGNVQASDWQGRDRHDQHQDDRRPAPLPPGVRICLVAATLSETTNSLKTRLLGDGLVPLASALGQHGNDGMSLPIPADRTLIVPHANHFDLLSRPDVYAQLKVWLSS